MENLLRIQRNLTKALNRAQNNEDSIESYVLAWDITFPVDRWWRRKHKIPFGSDEHGNSSFQYMIFEYLEDMMYTRLEDVSEDKYIAGSGDIFRKLTKEEEESEYDKIWDDINITKLKQ